MTNHDLTTGSIVVAWDGSAHAERALEWGAAQAVREGRTLDLVHVSGSGETQTAIWATAGGSSVTPGQEEARAAKRALLDAVAAGVRSKREGLEIRSHVIEGVDPRALLLELSHAAHLLVLGSRGRGPVASLLLGSVSAAVSQHAACPVVVARPPSGDDDGPWDGIVVGADGSTESLPVIEFAFRQASLTSLPLTVVHCYRDVIAGVGYAFAVPETEDLHVVLGESIAGMAEKFPDVEVTSRLQRGLTAQALTVSVRSWDLIVVGRHDRTAWNRVLVGSVAGAVLERANTTVAVIPEAAEGDQPRAVLA